MASPLSNVLARFEARIHRTKNRQVSIPADVQRRLRLVRQADNHLILYSIRLTAGGRWQHLWSQLTFDNEFAVPAAAAHIEQGSVVEVKIHRVVKNVDALSEAEEPPSGAALLLHLAVGSGEDERSDGSRSVDEYLYGSADG